MSLPLDVLVTLPFTAAQLDRLRAVSPQLVVTRADAASADYGRTNVLYAVAPPRDLARAPAARGAGPHSAGQQGLRPHPLHAKRASAIVPTRPAHTATGPRR